MGSGRTARGEYSTTSSGDERRDLSTDIIATIANSFKEGIRFTTHRLCLNKDEGIIVLDLGLDS